MTNFALFRFARLWFTYAPLLLDTSRSECSCRSSGSRFPWVTKVQNNVKCSRSVKNKKKQTSSWQLVIFLDGILAPKTDRFRGRDSPILRTEGTWLPRDSMPTRHEPNWNLRSYRLSKPINRALAWQNEISCSYNKWKSERHCRRIQLYDNKLSKKYTQDSLQFWKGIMQSLK